MAVVSVVDGEAQARQRKRWLILGAVRARRARSSSAPAPASTSPSTARSGCAGCSRPTSRLARPRARRSPRQRRRLAEDTWPGLRKARSAAGRAARRPPDPRGAGGLGAVGLLRAAPLGHRRSGAGRAGHQLARGPRRAAAGQPRADQGRGRRSCSSESSPTRRSPCIRPAKLDAAGPLLEAEALLQKGQAAEAATVLEGAVKTTPSGAGWHALGLAHLKLKKPDKAQADFEAALKVAPQHLSSAIELAQLALGRKEPAGRAEGPGARAGRAQGAGPTRARPRARPPRRARSSSSASRPMRWPRSRRR